MRRMGFMERHHLRLSASGIGNDRRMYVERRIEQKEVMLEVKEADEDYKAEIILLDVISRASAEAAKRFITGIKDRYLWDVRCIG